LEARNASDRRHLAITALQLITPHLPDTPNNEPKRERGQDLDNRYRYQTHWIYPFGQPP
jgi:hypothetical protein